MQLLASQVARHIFRLDRQMSILSWHLFSKYFLFIFNICWQNPKYRNYAKSLLWLQCFCDMIYCRNIKLKLDQESILAILSYQDDVVLLYSIVSENIVTKKIAVAIFKMWEYKRGGLQVWFFPILQFETLCWPKKIYLMGMKKSIF